MTKRGWRVLCWLVLSAVVGVGCWWQLGPVWVTREVTVLPGTAGCVEWRRADGRVNGAWVGPGNTDHVRMPARGVTAWRSLGVPAEVHLRVAGIRLSTESVGPSETWTALRDAAAWWDALLCAAAGVLACLVGLAVRAGCVCESSVEAERPSGTSTRGWWDVLFVLSVGGVVHGTLLVIAPMMFCPDSMDYAVRAKELLAGGSMQTFDALRPPGFSVLLAGLLWLGTGVVPALGVLHAALATAMMWMAQDVVGRLSGRGWGVVAGLLVGINPLALMWGRHVMPEFCAMWCATGVLWCLVRGGDRFGWAVLAGLFCAMGAYLRANLQVLVVLAPLVIVLGGLPGWRSGVVRRVGAAVACAAAALLSMAPWVVRNQREMGVAAFAVGSNYAVVLNGWDAGMIDLNQSAVWDAEQVRALSTPGVMHSGFDVMREIDRARTLEGSSGHPWVQAEARRQVVAQESLERWPDRRWSTVGRAWLSVSGIWPVDRPGYRENAWWAGGFAHGTPTGTNFWNRPEEYGHLDRSTTGAIFEASQESTRGWNGSGSSSVMDTWHRAWVWVWPAISVLGIVGVVCVWRHGLVGRGIVFAMPLGHAGILAMLTLTGIDRYQVPLTAWMVTVGVVGLAGTTRALRWVMRRGRPCGGD